MPAVEDDLVVEQGSEWAHGWGSSKNPPVGVLVNGEVIDDTWTARSQVRRRETSTAVLHEFVADVDADGFVKIAVSGAVSAAWEWSDGVYDVLITSPSGQTYRVAEGRITVDPGVTRD